MSDALNMKLDDVIKMNKNKGKKGGPAAGSKQKGFGKSKAPAGKKFARPVKGAGAKGADSRQQKRAIKPTTGKGGKSREDKPKHILRPTGKTEKPGKPAPKRQAEEKQILVQSRTQLRVANLDAKITNQELFELFSVIGSLTKCKIDYDDLGKSKHTATIEYEEVDSAKKAIEEYNGNILDGKMLEVKYSKVKKAAGIQRRADFRKEKDAAPARQSTGGRRNDDRNSGRRSGPPKNNSSRGGARGGARGGSKQNPRRQGGASNGKPRGK